MKKLILQKKDSPTCWCHLITKRVFFESDPATYYTGSVHFNEKTEPLGDCRLFTLDTNLIRTIEADALEDCKVLAEQNGF